jgi:hypothetical protein
MFARAPTVDAVDKSGEDGAVAGHPLAAAKVCRFQPFRGVGRDIFSFVSGLTKVLMWAFSGAFGVSLP